jgi:hypothetical protein
VLSAQFLLRIAIYLGNNNLGLETSEGVSNNIIFLKKKLMISTAIWD